MAGVLCDPLQQLAELAVRLCQLCFGAQHPFSCPPWLPSRLASQALLQPTGKPEASNGPFKGEGPRSLM